MQTTATKPRPSVRETATKPRPSVRETVRQIMALQKQRHEAWLAGDKRTLKETELRIDRLNRAL
jgi:hypothetical protein